MGFYDTLAYEEIVGLKINSTFVYHIGSYPFFRDAALWAFFKYRIEDTFFSLLPYLANNNYFSLFPNNPSLLLSPSLAVPIQPRSWS